MFAGRSSHSRGTQSHPYFSRDALLESILSTAREISRNRNTFAQTWCWKLGVRWSSLELASCARRWGTGLPASDATCTHVGQLDPSTIQSIPPLLSLFVFLFLSFFLSFFFSPPPDTMSLHDNAWETFQFNSSWIAQREKQQRQRQCREATFDGIIEAPVGRYTSKPTVPSACCDVSNRR